MAPAQNSFRRQKNVRTPPPRAFSSWCTGVDGQNVSEVEDTKRLPNHPMAYLV